MNRRDLAADVVCVLLAVCGGLLLLAIRDLTLTRAPVLALDLSIGAVSCVAVWFRRRWPTGVALLTVVTQVVSVSSGMAAFIAVGNAGIRRPIRTAVGLACLHIAAMLAYFQLWHPREPLWVEWSVATMEFTAVLVYGMYLRARRQLISTLHERVAEAVAAQQVMADQAKLAERARIAGEMHDVLAHRVSLVALHAGALEIQPDLPADAVRQTAGLIRSTARQALTELRDVIGVLRDPSSADAAPHAPQPTLASIAGLVEEYRTAGLTVSLNMDIPDSEAAPGTLGRDAYRIVREGLANVTKHAAGTAARVSLAGRPGDGLRVTIHNRLPLAYQAPVLPGAGAGLVGLAERVALAGGTLRHGPDTAGNFVLTADLRWQEAG